LAAITLGLVLTSCGLLKSDPPGGISRAEAEAIALSQYGGSVLSAEAKGLNEAVAGDPNPGPPRSTAVWAVVLEGSWSGSCPLLADGTAGGCAAYDRATVVLDFRTGQFIMAQLTGGAP
jgi:hypothetical protein